MEKRDDGEIKLLVLELMSQLTAKVSMLWYLLFAIFYGIVSFLPHRSQLIIL